MVLSMTGFSSEQIDLQVDKDSRPVHLSIELKTLNSRFFEASCKLPGSLGALEGKVISMMRAQLLRGRAFLTVKFVDSAVAMEKLAFSKHIAAEYISEVEEMRKHFNLSGQLTVSDIIQLPHVFSFERLGLNKSSESLFISGIKKTLSDVQLVREAEGKFLHSDLDARLQACSMLIKKVGSRNKVMIKDMKAQVSELSSRVQKGEGEVHAKLDEMVHQLDKIDVHEELSRFNAHASAAKRVLESSSLEKGKKLDFISQELLRETNTLAAKCSDYEIAALAVDIKVELEKVREQAQNVV